MAVAASSPLWTLPATPTPSMFAFPWHDQAWHWWLGTERFPFVTTRPLITSINYLDSFPCKKDLHPGRTRRGCFSPVLAHHLPQEGGGCIPLRLLSFPEICSQRRSVCPFDEFPLRPYSLTNSAPSKVLVGETSVIAGEGGESWCNVELTDLFISGPCCHSHIQGKAAWSCLAQDRSPGGALNACRSHAPQTII